MITGEPIPADKSKDDIVTGGTINGNTSFTMIAQKIGSDTLLSQIIEMVNKANSSKAPIQKLADIVVCPCTLGLATSKSIMICTDRGAQSGVLVN